MQIDPGPISAEGLFSTYKFLEVPTFQRGYAWKKEHLDSFLRDLKSAAESQDTHFFGPIVLLRDQGSSRAEIVDGQQRVSTLVMCISILRDIIWEMDEHIVHKGSLHERNLKVVCHQALFHDDDKQRFKAAHPIRTVFEERVIQHPSDPSDTSAPPRLPLTSHGAQMSRDEIRNTRELRAAWLHLDARLRLYEKTGEFEEQKEQSESDETRRAPTDEERRIRVLSLLRALTQDFSIYTMVLSSEQDAYVLFETLNHRGLRLTPGDILKTMTLKEIHKKEDPDRLTEALRQWDGIGRNLDDFDISRFLRHFLLAVEQTPVKRAEVLERFRTRIGKKDPDQAVGAQKTLQELSRASLQYSRLIGVTDGDDQELEDSAKRLNVLGDTHRVFMLGVLQHTRQMTTAERRMLFRASEYLHFRWTLAGRNAQILENSYLDFLSKLKNQTCAAVVEEIVKAAPTNEQFKGAEASSEMLNSNADHVRYLLQRLEAEHGGNTPHWGAGSNLTLEHLAPQNPPSESEWYARIAAKDGDGPVYDNFLNRWGNLTILEWKLNTAVKNSDWRTKVNGRTDRDRCIKRSTYNVNKDFASVPRWTVAQIDHRTDWMRDSMLTLLSDEWVRTGTSSVRPWKPLESPTQVHQP